ncbi:sensor histidine kinase inhibitor, KipI family [Paenibacillus sp. 1_12]|uniref:5-oxoprolinase subunit PxpB n=1 Tax=Paenibacillus sp. 1_12 TaxID=1566278 RepID=UPI0008E26090|nr:5-oxoprolinase subunit PxpB [Paenibacillus sp. 1_12]SFL53210.1 sensor histidine kinase inhibitor, KipI family [Paenibacillus sp. 1_12]
MLFSNPGPTYTPLGDQVLLLQFKQEVSMELNLHIHQYIQVIVAARIKGIQQVAASFCSISIHYDPVLIRYQQLVQELQQIDMTEHASVRHKGKTIHVPVVYGGGCGPDLDYVADRAGLSPEEVVRIHSAGTYLIYMLGFIASFPYCGDIDSRLMLPRRTNPRLKVEKGSIAIVNRQTSIYPVSSPGGWHIIGRTPLDTFNPYLDPPSLLRAGDYVKFVAITDSEAECWNEYTGKEWIEQWQI